MDAAGENCGWATMADTAVSERVVNSVISVCAASARDICVQARIDARGALAMLYKTVLGLVISMFQRLRLAGRVATNRHRIARPRRTIWKIGQGETGRVISSRWSSDSAGRA